MKLEPVSENNAQGVTKQIFEEVKDVFNITYVPLLYQYLAVDERYLSYIWERIKGNTESKDFGRQAQRIQVFSQKAVSKIYSPSNEMLLLRDTFTDSERTHLQKTVEEVTRLNAKLLLISFALRESIKGIPLEQLSLDAKRTDTYHSPSMRRQEEPQKTDMSGHSADFAMGLTLFGTGALDVLPYPKFFNAITEEMESFQEKEAYLQTRVGLEQVAQMSLALLPIPMRTSLRELSEMIPDTEVLYELLSILKHRFPPQFPHLLLTSVVMGAVLRGEEKNAIMR